MFVVQPGVDERLDGFCNGIFDGAQGSPELLVVGVVPPVEQSELVLPAHHQAEVGREAHLDLLAGSIGLQARRCGTANRSSWAMESTNSR